MLGLNLINTRKHHYSDVIMSATASQIAGVRTVCSTVSSGADQRKYQNSVLLTFVRGIHRWPVDYSHKGPVTRKCMFPFDDDIMCHTKCLYTYNGIYFSSNAFRRSTSRAVEQITSNEEPMRQVAINTLPPRQNGRRFAVDISNWIFCDKNCCILIQISEFFS